MEILCNALRSSNFLCFLEATIIAHLPILGDYKQQMRLGLFTLGENKITKLVVIKDSFLIPIQPFAPSFQATITLQLLSLGRYKAAKLHPFET